ncbi:MAG: HDOD domain-containing protein [Deltaproteobacteria bacterium]|nr:HDOD domain-containing protein [Deltaproteobacteria bacterium]MBW1738350.1 HDOD domain-containing protein [Deltaproteobacteria bacterium]MBW1910936.1 HDOD domain-containing protein [Deltaproteobacteria bacterium]MBW2034964.1 HDOD domain-containing protein [Deltaproteobacteria bacterium]MBW2115593.1 HDOD domain-containing protein [Deltaproteobacteria bacterium]
MSSKSRLEEIIKSIENLPPFPEVARRILELAEALDAGPNDTLDIIQYDQAITANCLRVCNSSYFGLPVKIFAIDQAVRMLGLQNIIKIVLANFKGLSPYKKAYKGYGLNSGELWRHSVGCATLSQILLCKAGLQKDSVLFTAALLHDVGKLVLDRYVAENYEEITCLVKKNGLSFVEAEKGILGIDHAEAGGIIAQTWDFPLSLTNSIRNHHESMTGKVIPNLEAWVRLSNLVYHVSPPHLLCSHREGITCKVDQAILFQFGFKQEDINEILDALPAEMREAEEMLKVTI